MTVVLLGVSLSDVCCLVYMRSEIDAGMVYRCDVWHVTWAVCVACVHYGSCRLDGMFCSAEGVGSKLSWLEHGVGDAGTEIRIRSI